MLICFSSRCIDVLRLLTSGERKKHTELATRARKLLHGVCLPAPNHICAEKFISCRNSISLLNRTQPSILKNFVPAYVVGDGNCLFCSVSLAMYGTESHHILFRTLAAVEVFEHRTWYDASDANSEHPLRKVADIVLPSYDELCREVAGLGQYCDISAVLAVSSVLGLPVQTFWPPLHGLCLQHPLMQLVVGRHVQSHTKAITIIYVKKHQFIT